ncbi:hypothetical protein CEXT_604791 [Caerostris extrusa]|uniref:Uncharacterized protein n=1 Tax=Caerostris extrusa TaxID=172846 RepID=A0AAV4TY94_CAEEX|nr:hypothetical protein CEXT_604791 [Caerostris extrusa]
MNRQFHLESNRLLLGREVKVISQVICASPSLLPEERKCREAPKAAKIFPHNSHSSPAGRKCTMNGNSNSAP